VLLVAGHFGRDEGLVRVAVADVDRRGRSTVGFVNQFFGRNGLFSFGKIMYISILSQIQDNYL
jgi:hypothetical protein